MQKNEKEKRKEAVISAIGNLKNKHGIGASEITAILTEEITKEKNKKIRETCEKNANLEGKCFVRHETPASTTTPMRLSPRLNPMDMACSTRVDACHS